MSDKPALSFFFCLQKHAARGADEASCAPAAVRHERSSAIPLPANCAASSTPALTKKRMGRAWVVCLAVVCLLAMQAHAASFVIKVGATNTVSFAPTAQTIAVGDTVIFEFMRAGDRGE